jgi:hypothetical protein
LLRILRRGRWRTMAGNSRKKYAYEKECTEHYSGSGGDMNKRRAG